MRLEQAIAAADYSLLDIPYMVARLHHIEDGAYCTWIICAAASVSRAWYYLSLITCATDTMDIINDRLLDNWFNAKPVSRLKQISDMYDRDDWELATLQYLLRQTREKLAPQLIPITIRIKDDTETSSG